MFEMVILYKPSVYISHKNNSKKKKKTKTLAIKLYKRQTVVTSYLIIFRKKKTIQFLRMRYRRDMDLYVAFCDFPGHPLFHDPST